MSDLKLTLAINDYDHVRDLVGGRVKPEGIELTCSQMPVEEIFYRFGARQEWDISELSMGMYCAAVSRGDAPFVAIPVFPSRVFRHSCIFVHRNGGIKSLSDLNGKRVGMPMWSQTASIYARGHVQHQGGVALSNIEWVQSGINDPGREEPAIVDLPAGVELRFEKERSLTELLLDRDIDAIISAHPPYEFEQGDKRIRRLFRNYRKVESEYFKKTGVFPIMHTIAIKRETFEGNRWIAKNLMNAFELAKRRGIARLESVTASQVALPWASGSVEEFRRSFFADGEYWPYGVAANRTTLQTFLDYCYEQGVAARRMSPHELFPEEAQFVLRV